MNMESSKFKMKWTPFYHGKCHRLQKVVLHGETTYKQILLCIFHPYPPAE